MCDYGIKNPINDETLPCEKAGKTDPDICSICAIHCNDRQVQCSACGETKTIDEMTKISDCVNEIEIELEVCCDCYRLIMEERMENGIL